MHVKKLKPRLVPGSPAAPVAFRDCCVWGDKSRALLMLPPDAFYT